jgi:hypothetical protein
MAAPTPAQKVANIQTLATPAVPSLTIPELPEKLRRIDPEGSAQFREKLQGEFDEWLQKLNTLGFIQQNQLNTITRKVG